MPYFFTNTSKGNKSSSSPSIRANPTNTTATTNTTKDTKDTMVTDAKPHPPVPVAVDTKDVRAFEHGRQKAKKTARTAHWREEKAHARRIKSGEVAAPPVEPLSTVKRERSGFRAPRVRPDWEDGWSAEDAADEWMREFVDEEMDGRIVRSESGRLEVDLTNLMKPAKARKAKRGMSPSLPSPDQGTAHRLTHGFFPVPAVGDFEVLPSVRQVVALEDRLDGELEADEPWEHLSVDGEDEKGFSYAEVAAIAC